MVTSDPWTLSTVRGYKLELSGTPYQHRVPIPPFLDGRELSLIEEEIASLLEKQAIQEIRPQGGLFYSNLFLVGKKGGGQRPVINLSILNNFIVHHHFKMEDLRVAGDLLQPHDYMCKIDLKDAYFAVPIHQSHQRFLCFQHKNITYQFKCLPFGLTSAPRVFTKVLKPLASYLRGMGLRICMYIDDMLILNALETGAKRDVALLIHMLENLGFVINYKKSILVPFQEIEFLGVLINSINMEFSLPENKLKNMIKECKSLVSLGTASQADLAHIIGKMTAAKAAVFQAPLHYRALQQRKAFLDVSKIPFHQKRDLDLESLSDLQWWIINLDKAHCRPVKPLLPDLIIQSDASGTGWGAVCEGVRTRGTWSLEESKLHINCQELLAATYAIKAFTKAICNVHVLVQMDNTSAIAYVNKMGGPRGVL